MNNALSDGRASPATMADVARRARVAKSTVSNYLSGKIKVSPATGLRIAEAIAALDYSPAEIARSFTSRRRTSQRHMELDTDVPGLTTVGHVSVDYIARLARLPAREDRIMVKEILKVVGGPAANIAAIAAGLADRWKVACSLLTAVGNDVDSDWAIAELSGRGVHILTPSREGRLARALVLVEPDARRTIVAEPISVGNVDLDLFIAANTPPKRAWCLHFEGFQLPQQYSRVLAARRAGFRTSMHTTGLPEPWLRTQSDKIFSAFDVLTIQQETLAAIPGCPIVPQEAADVLAERARTAECWPEAVIVSQRLDGAYLIERDGRITHCINTDFKPKDETGAADALVGTFLVLWLHGVPSVLALPCACAAAGIVATQFGAQEMRPKGSDLAPYVGSGAL